MKNQLGSSPKKNLCMRMLLRTPANFKLALNATMTLTSCLILVNCAPKDRGYGLNAPGFKGSALSLQDQSPQYVRHALAGLDHARASLEFAIANPAKSPSGCHAIVPSEISTQTADTSAPPTSAQPPVPAPGSGSPDVPSTDSPPVSISGVAILGSPVMATSLIRGRTLSLLLKYSDCTEKSELISRATQNGQEYFVVSYGALGEEVTPNTVTVQTDLRYELARVGSKFDKVQINQVASLTFAKASETEVSVTYNVAYDARESFDLDVQLTRRFGQLNPTFNNVNFTVDKKTRKVTSLGTPRFSLFANIEQWKKSDNKGTSLGEKKYDTANLTLAAQGEFKVAARSCQLPEGKLDVSFTAKRGAAASDDDTQHFRSAAGRLFSSDIVSIDQGMCAVGSSNLDPQQAGFLGDFEPLFMN